MRATTREHALPSWVIKAMAQPSGTTTLTLARGTQVATSWNERRERRGLKVKHLCSACNNSWMSDLEQRAKVYIRSMMGDVAIPLDREAQALISSWIMKTVMVYECLSPKDEWFYSETERRVFRETHELPHYTAIWLGRCRESGWSRTVGRRIRFGPRWPFAIGALNTFCISHFIFQVLTTRMKPGREHRGTRRYNAVKAPDPWARRLFQCWPVQQRQVYWPPLLAAAADDSEVQSLSRRWDAEGLKSRVRGGMA